MPADRDPLDPYDPTATALPAPTPAEAVALARLYDLDLAQDPGDLDLYMALAGRTGGPILELATGTGRLAVPLAEQGYLVTGVDIDPAMLARAQARETATRGDAVGGLRFVIGDARSVRLPDAGRYRLAFLALNSLFIMGSRADQQAAVATLAAHLAPGGLAVVDVWLPDADDLARYDGRLVLEYPRRDPATGQHVVKVGSAVHDAATGTVRLTTIYEEGRPGPAGGPVGPQRRDAARRRRRAPRVRRGGRPRRGDHRRRVRPGAARPGRRAGHPHRGTTVSLRG